MFENIKKNLCIIAKKNGLKITEIIEINKIENPDYYRYFFLPVDINYYFYKDIYPEFYEVLYGKKNLDFKQLPGYHNLSCNIKYIDNVSNPKYGNKMLFVAFKINDLKFLSINKYNKKVFFSPLKPKIIFEIKYKNNVCGQNYIKKMEKKILQKYYKDVYNANLSIYFCKEKKELCYLIK